MNIPIAIFLFGCAVTALVVLGLVFAFGALAGDGSDAYEGRAAGNDDD